MSSKERGSNTPSFSLNIVKSGHIMCYKIGLFYLLLTVLKKSGSFQQAADALPAHFFQRIIFFAVPRPVDQKRFPSTSCKFTKPQKRLSALSSRLSPITKRFFGTATGPKLSRAEPWQDKRYCQNKCRSCLCKFHIDEYIFVLISILSATPMTFNVVF